MAADKPRKPSPFNPQTLLEAQRRNFDAFTNAGQIVADGMRTYAERQIAMVQEAMGSLWTELQAGAREPAAPAAAPVDHLDRMRGAFEKVVVQVQELGNLLIKTQDDAIAVLNDCAARNLESLGGGAAASDFAQLQKRAKDAFEDASRRTTAVVDEMKRRMASLEEETRKTAAPKAPAEASASRRAAAPAGPTRAPAKSDSAPRARRAPGRKAPPKKG